MTGVSIVIPTLGRPSLAGVLTALADEAEPPLPVEVLVVDDRPSGAPLPIPPGLAVTVLPGRSAGPAAARNLGWRAARYAWVAFLDDDVVPEPGWLTRLVTDVDALPDVGGVQGRVRVPLPAGRRPTDWERCTAGLADANWITADMAYRRAALVAVGGFDERFPRAFREDAELAYRVRCAGWRLVRGERRVTHPVRREGPWVSLRTQRGNADDALLRRLYGPRWRTLLGLPRGRRLRHAAVTVAAAVAIAAACASARRHAAGFVPVIAAAAWLGGTVEFTLARLTPGPGTPREVLTMVVTSPLIPPLATVHWLRGWWWTARPVSGRK